MKQYKKGRKPAYQIFYCNRKGTCSYSPACGNECILTFKKSWARKDSKGRPVKESRMLPI